MRLVATQLASRARYTRWLPQYGSQSRCQYRGGIVDTKRCYCRCRCRSYHYHHHFCCHIDDSHKQSFELQPQRYNNHFYYCHHPRYQQQRQQQQQQQQQQQPSIVSCGFSRLEQCTLGQATGLHRRHHCCTQRSWRSTLSVGQSRPRGHRRR